MKKKLMRGLLLATMSLTLAACPLGRGSKKLGEACASSNECEGARCQASLCTSACKSDADCSPASVRMKCEGNTKSATNPEAWGVCAVSP